MSQKKAKEKRRLEKQKNKQIILEVQNGVVGSQVKIKPKDKEE